MPAVSDVQFDGRLSNVSVQYKNDELIADLVLPPTPVAKKEGVFKIYDKDQRFTVPDTKVGPKSEPNEVEWDVTEGNYACKDEGLQEFVSNEEIDNADAPIQPMSDTTEFVTNLVMLAKEKRAADFVFASANYGANNQVDIAGAWATLTDDVLADLIAGIDACFLPPNVLVMGMPTWRKVSRNEKILAAVKGTLKPQNLKGPGGVAQPLVDHRELAEFLGLAHVLVSGARINSAKKGQTASYKRVWDGTNATKGGAALLRVKPGTAMRDVVSAANFTWKQRQVFVNESTRGAFGGKMVRVVESCVYKSIATDVGYLFKDCLVT